MRTYDALARILDYPGPDLAQAAAQARLPSAPMLAAQAARLGTEAVEELYARTFDLVPEHTLDLGYQLFGESYKRGVFLVKMQAALRAAGVDPGRELPDHLPALLRLLSRVEPPDARDLADEVILPALDKILRAFPESENPYRALLQETLALLQEDFAIAVVRPVPEEHTPRRPPGMVSLPVLGSELQPPPLPSPQRGEGGEGGVYL